MIAPDATMEYPAHPDYVNSLCSVAANLVVTNVFLDNQCSLPDYSIPPSTYAPCDNRTDSPPPSSDDLYSVAAKLFVNNAFLDSQQTPVDYSPYSDTYAPQSSPDAGYFSYSPLSISTDPMCYMNDNSGYFSNSPMSISPGPMSYMSEEMSITPPSLSPQVSAVPTDTTTPTEAKTDMNCCKICGIEFNKFSHLKAHQNISHKNSLTM